jgi:hypothetical protein
MQGKSAAASHSDSYLSNLREATREFIIAWYGVLYEAHRQSSENDVCLAKQHYHRLSPEQAQAKVLLAAETLRKTVSGPILERQYPDLAQMLRDADNIVDRGNIGVDEQFCLSIDEATKMLDRAKYCLTMFDRQLVSILHHSRRNSDYQVREHCTIPGCQSQAISERVSQMRKVADGHVDPTFWKKQRKFGPAGGPDELVLTTEGDLRSFVVGAQVTPKEAEYLIALSNAGGAVYLDDKDPNSAKVFRTEFGKKYYDSLVWGKLKSRDYVAAIPPEFHYHGYVKQGEGVKLTSKGEAAVRAGREEQDRLLERVRRVHGGERTSSMKRTAALDLNKLLASTVQVMRRQVAVWLALLNEADEGDTTCVSSVEGEYKRWSADAIQDKVQQAVETLYNLLQMWQRLPQEQLPSPAKSLLKGLHQFSDMIAVTVQKALDAQPDRYCINVAETTKLAESAKKLQKYSERLPQHLARQDAIPQQKMAAVQKKALIWARLREAEVKTAAMTDTDVHAEVAKIKKVLRMKETKAQRAYQQEKDACFAQFGSTDVEQAARSCGMSRVKTVLSKKLTLARDEYQQRLDDLRARAGEWADLVPVK